MATWATLRSAVLTKLQSVSELQAVYNHHTGNFSGYPAAMFEPASDPASYITNRDNEHIYSFDIYIVQELTNQGRGASVGTLVTAVDAVIAAFEADFSLGGACLMAEAMANDWGEDNGPDGPVKFAHVLLKCHTITQAF